MSKLIISNLTKNIKSKTLLNNINLSLDSGEIYGVIGENGAGKTTLFRCVLGLSKAVGEIITLHAKDLEICEIIFNDKVVDESNYNHFLTKIGVVFPFPDILSFYTVEEIFANHLQYYECRSTDIKAYLKKFGLNVSLEDKISRFSLGMKQRLNIALACFHNPEILILDEPFNGLDREGIILLQELLLKLKEEGKIIIISSHSFSELESIADHLIVIHQGEVLTELSIENIRRQGFETLEQFYRELKEVRSI